MARLLNFKALVYGRNFRLAFVKRRREVVRLTGFYAVRRVRAAGPHEAELAVMDLLRHDPALRAELRNKPNDPPLMFLEDLVQVSSFGSERVPGSGFVYFHGRGAGRPRSVSLAPASSPRSKARNARGSRSHTKKAT
jgi:hypothetical protein